LGEIGRREKVPEVQAESLDRREEPEEEVEDRVEVEPWCGGPVEAVEAGRRPEEAAGGPWRRGTRGSMAGTGGGRVVAARGPARD
jgi:hypothetical protein